jgi:hypothetical protein
MRGYELHSSPRPYTTTAAALTDAVGIKTDAAAPVALTVYNGAALNGAVHAAGFVFPRYPTVLTAVSAATYNTTDPILVLGTRGGVAVTVPLLLTAAGGGETITGTTPLETITSITVPIQLQAAGGLSFGVVDMGPFPQVLAGVIGEDMPYRRAKATAAGTLVFGFDDGTTDSTTCVAGGIEDVLFYRLYGTSTATPITVYT